MTASKLSIRFFLQTEPLVPKDFSHSGLSFFETFTRALRSLFEPSASLSTMTKNSFGKLLSIKDGAGADISANPVLRTSFTFTGREFDEESGLYYYRARSYNPEIGRFLQVDPDPGRLSLPSSHLNRYSYVSNLPTSSRDPSGQSILSNFLGDLENFGHGMIANFGAGFDSFVKQPGFQSPGFQLMVVLIAACFIGPSAMGATASAIGFSAFVSGAASWYVGNRSWEAFTSGANGFLSDPAAVKNAAIAGLLGYGYFTEATEIGGVGGGTMFFAGAYYSASVTMSEMPTSDMSNEEQLAWFGISFIAPYKAYTPRK
jgi:RHS repeat-associated protein